MRRFFWPVIWEVYCMGRGKKKGSITVEAVFVVPLCLAVIFLLLEGGLYLHHQSWYREAAWECVLAGAGGENGAAGAMSHWEGLAANQPFPIRKVEAKASEKEERLNMSLQGSVSGVWGAAGMDFEIRVQREQLRPAEFVRQVRRLKKLGEEEIQ